MSRVNTFATEEEFFYSKIIKRSNGCWEWQGQVLSSGYGVANSSALDILREYAHRFSYRLFKGPIPAGMLVRHRCDNPTCVRPSHLLLGTNQDNMDDKVKRSRSLTGERNPNAKLEPMRVMEIYRDGQTNAKTAECYGVSIQTVSYIRTGRLWSSVTGHSKPL